MDKVYYFKDYWFLSIPESCYGGSTNDRGLVVEKRIKIKEIKFKNGFPLKEE